MAPQSTPVAAGTPTAEATRPITYMFVQSFTAGSIAPQAHNPGMYTLTLRRGIDQTVYFSDRPERIFGLVETDKFLKELGFTPANPPNAALVAHQGPGGADLIVLELQNPHYDRANETLTYDVKVLQDTRHTPLHYNNQPVTAIDHPRVYGASALFIDDCPDTDIYCFTPDSLLKCEPVGAVKHIGTCWHWECLCCSICNYGGPTDVCNKQVPACAPNCIGRTPSEYTKQCGVGG